MKNVLTLISAAAITTAMAAPAFSQALPLNNTVAGGQGEVAVDGQGAAALSGMAIAAGLATLVIIASATSDTD